MTDATPISEFPISAFLISVFPIPTSRATTFQIGITLHVTQMNLLYYVWF